MFLTDDLILDDLHKLIIGFYLIYLTFFLTFNLIWLSRSFLFVSFPFFFPFLSFSMFQFLFCSTLDRSMTFLNFKYVMTNLPDNLWQQFVKFYNTLHPVSLGFLEPLIMSIIIKYFHVSYLLKVTGFCCVSAV